MTTGQLLNFNTPSTTKSPEDKVVTEYNSSVHVSTVQDGIYALAKIHNLCPVSQKFPRVTSETVAVSVSILGMQSLQSILVWAC